MALYTSSRGDAGGAASYGAAKDQGLSSPGSLNAREVEVGVAIFDNPHEMTSGWASRAGSAPFSFTNPADLSNDAIWLLTLHYDEYQRGAKNIANFRRTEYLRSSLTAVASDLGIRMAGRFASEAVRPLAAVANQAVALALQSYGWSAMTDLREESLADDIRRSLPTVPKAPTHIRSMLMSAYQSFSKPTRDIPFEPRSMLVTLRLNRLSYARQILQTMVPDEAWTYVEPKQAASMSAEDFLNPEQPTLVEAAVELDAIDPSISSLIAFGSTGLRRTGGLRRWISQPELAWICRHARVRITGALIARSAKVIPGSMLLPPKLLADPLHEFSLSAGLVAESHWNALAAQTYNRNGKCYEVTSWAVWLRAMDRAMSFALALQAQKAGFVVTWYSNGAIGVNVTRDRLQELLAFAESNSLMFPCFTALFEEMGADLATA